MIASLILWTKATFLPYGAYGLFGLSFIESSFFPIPPDFLLIALVLAAPEQAVFLALICLLASVLGGLLGYAIGDFGGRPLLHKWFSERKINHVHHLFEKYEAWAIGMAALTPIPYKVFTIAAGVFKVSLPRFIIASILGRGARFFAVALLLKYYGVGMMTFIDKYFNILSILATLLAVLTYLAYRLIKRNIHKSS